MIQNAAVTRGVPDEATGPAGLDGPPYEGPDGRFVMLLARSCASACVPALVSLNRTPQNGQLARFGLMGPRPSSLWQFSQVHTISGGPGMLGALGPGPFG